MTTPLRKLLMVSAAVISVTSIPVIQPAGDLFSSAAYARGGSDDSGGDDHGGRSGGGGSGDDHGGRSGNDDSGGDDHGGRGGHDDSGDDDHGGRSGRGGDHDRGDDHGRNRGRDHAEDDNNGNEQGENRSRPEVVLSVSRESLKGLLNGSLVAVDQLGRRLEIEVENEHGVRVVKAEVHRSDAVRNPGPITSVKVVAP